MPPLLNAGRDFCAPHPPPPPHYHHRQSDKPNTSNYEGSQFNHIHLGCSFRRFQQPCKTARFLCAHSSVIVAVSGSSAPGSAKPPSAVRRAARGGGRGGVDGQWRRSRGGTPLGGDQRPAWSVHFPATLSHRSPDRLSSGLVTGASQDLKDMWIGWLFFRNVYSMLNNQLQYSLSQRTFRDISMYDFELIKSPRLHHVCERLSGSPTEF